MINKNYLIFAVAIALASCSVDEYMGENPEFTQTTKENIIGFGGNTGSMSRATSNKGNVEDMLDKHFKVYGWKEMSDGTTQKVFENYWVWYNDAKTTSNSKNWEYVGTTNTHMPFGSTNLDKIQYIKYWDYSAIHYRFVAGTPQDQVTFNFDEPSKNVNKAEVTGLAGHIDPRTSATSLSQNPVYISAPIQINKSSNTSQKYGDPVQLTFTRLQTKVRVGIYETIPGYSIESIEFYKYDVNSSSSEKFSKEETYNNNVILTSTKSDYFNGGANVKATVDYTWTGANAPSYTVAYVNGDNSTGYESSNNWYGGKFSGVKATSSNPTTIPSGSSSIKEALYGTDNDMDDHGYFTVLSTTETTPSALVIKCDFTLKAVDTNEEIKVTGATAAIPAAYCKWDENKMYTYIFKISQNTNGTTGTGSSDPDGLYPITFDAAATATEEGVETIVQTPSITTHQTGCVVTTGGIEYKTNTAIDITVMNEGTALTLNKTKDTQGYIAVYNLGATEADAKTEAELTVTGPTGQAETGLRLNDTNDKATFTPTTAGYYAIQYCVTSANTSTTPATPAAYKYKVIYVNDSSSSGS